MEMPHELLLTTRQKIKLRNAFNNNMSTNLKLSKAQISKIIKSGAFLGSLLSKLACPLMRVAIPLAKNVLAPLQKTAAAYGSGRPSSFASSTTNLIISNKEMKDIMKIAQALKDSNILLKESLKQIKTKQKNKKENS